MIDVQRRLRIDNMGHWPYHQDSWITADEVSLLRNWLDDNQQQFGALGGSEGAQYWQGRSVYWNQVKDAKVLSIMVQSHQRILRFLEMMITGEFGIEVPVYSEYLGFARWPVGYQLHPHADSEEPSGAPHPFPHRDFAAMIYLNDDFEGGEIFFPNQELELRPVPGVMVTFPGTLRYLHGVRPITQGVRHTIASFFTLDSSRQISLPS